MTIELSILDKIESFEKLEEYKSDYLQTFVQDWNEIPWTDSINQKNYAGSFAKWLTDYYNTPIYFRYDMAIGIIYESDHSYYFVLNKYR
ncbi:MAG: hypothetical protein HeimC3_43690 [Candidatus Heimdallarchaeota archaeon LC_3]|nr:MAG: hypothetical protein HeimC3_43690 [Candidatus Heimdallarchaeota archaeon LC_3]